MKYALDTNTLIYYFKGMGDVSTRLLAQLPTSIYIPAIVLYELETGLLKSESPQKRREQLQELLSVMEVLPFDDKVAEIAAQVRADLEKRGQPIGPLDVLIAGTALAYGCTLVTRNVGEFGRVQGLSVDNWF